MIQIILSEGAYISKTNKSSFEAISCHQVCFRNVEDAASVWKMKVHKSQAIFQNKLNFPLKCEKQWNYSNGRTTVDTEFLFWVKRWLGLHILLSLILTYCVNKPCFSTLCKSRCCFIFKLFRRKCQWFQDWSFPSTFSTTEWKYAFKYMACHISFIAYRTGI